MKEYKNIELDLLFRIDFIDLINYLEENPDMTKEQFNKKKKKLKSDFGFRQYYKRNAEGHEYVRLLDLENEFTPYVKYLNLLEKKKLLNCCQLEQAIGVFSNGELIAFLSTDVGCCYNTQAHFSAVNYILNEEESDFSQINTFYGKVIEENIEIIYSAKSNNIDLTKKNENLYFKVNKNYFENELNELATKTNDFFRKIKLEIKKEFYTKEVLSFFENVFSLNELK